MSIKEESSVFSFFRTPCLHGAKTFTKMERATIVSDFSPQSKDNSLIEYGAGVWPTPALLFRDAVKFFGVEISGDGSRISFGAGSQGCFKPFAGMPHHARVEHGLGGEIFDGFVCRAGTS